MRAASFNEIVRYDFSIQCAISSLEQRDQEEFERVFSASDIPNRIQKDIHKKGKIRRRNIAFGKKNLNDVERWVYECEVGSFTLL